MKIFGSDGFRCKFGTKFLTTDFLKKFSLALGSIYNNYKMLNPILISRDTRLSGNEIERIIVSELNSMSINTCITGVLPTPAVSKILNSNKYSLGVMITASHNSHEDNGIKLFNQFGSKLEKSVENEIERFILDNNLNKKKFETYGKNISINNLYQFYTKNIFEAFSIKNLCFKYLVDCSNGAFSEPLNKFFIDNDNFLFKNNKPNGENINLGCGALEIEGLLKIVEETNCDYGAAFDGDGDRCVFVSKKYGVIETEKLAALFLEHMFRNKLTKKIVASEISNLGLKENISKLGGELLETEVGDRFVINKVNEINANFGFEPSGHFFFPNLNSSMDGFATFLMFISLVESRGELFEKDLLKLKHYKRESIDLNINDVDQDLLNKLIYRINKLIDNENEKIVIRKSMWDPVIRVKYDYRNNNNFDNILNEIKNFLY